jgi:hypothetical protein
MLWNREYCGWNRGAVRRTGHQYPERRTATVRVGLGSIKILKLAVGFAQPLWTSGGRDGFLLLILCPLGILGNGKLSHWAFGGSFLLDPQGFVARRIDPVRQTYWKSPERQRQLQFLHRQVQGQCGGFLK